jgi:pyruvate kinase
MTMDVMRIHCAHDGRPKIVETVRFLAGIIGRMDEHFVKQRATLRKLSVAQLKDH